MRAVYVSAAKSYAEHEMEENLRRLMAVIPGVNENESIMLLANGWIQQRLRRLQCSREHLTSIQLQQQ